ncbi:MAG: hypothetical protein Tsb009_23040 [Planctomycetaceae bacterium]
MCVAVAVAKTEVPDHVVQKQLARLAEREGVPELRFSFRDPLPELPVEHDGQFCLYEWGNRSGAGKLPKTGWCRMESLEEGKWRWLKPEEVIIPANFGLEKGRWFHIEEGIRGILVRDESERPHVYMLTEPASHYYRGMTRHDRMPVLLGEGI